MPSPTAPGGFVVRSPERGGAARSRAGLRALGSRGDRSGRPRSVRRLARARACARLRRRRSSDARARAPRARWRPGRPSPRRPHARRVAGCGRPRARGRRRTRLRAPRGRGSAPVPPPSARRPRSGARSPTRPQRVLRVQPRRVVVAQRCRDRRPERESSWTSAAAPWRARERVPRKPRRALRRGRPRPRRRRGGRSLRASGFPIPGSC